VHAPAVVTATGALFLCAACGGPVTHVQSARTWRPNARQLLGQLRGDLTAVQSIDISRRTFTDTGDQYILLVAYSDLAGCSSMAAATAAPERVIRVLAKPCPQLEQAAELFTQAEASSDPRVLARAEREAGLAEPALVRATAAVR
jgi:hypothetical protein